MQNDGFVEPTTSYWQALLPAGAAAPEPPYRYGFPAQLPDGRHLLLPIRRRPGSGDRAVASLIPNHASFAVIDALAGFMAELAAPLRPDVVAGMPTLGLALAPPVAQRLGHPNFVPFGYSRKFWYEDAYAAPVHSITSPDASKAVYLDPNLLPRLAGRRVVLVDDTISSGSTALAVLDLLARTDAQVVGLVFAMSQGEAWRDRLGPTRSDMVRWVFRSPLLRAVVDGWVPD